MKITSKYTIKKSIHNKSWIILSKLGVRQVDSECLEAISNYLYKHYTDSDDFFTHTNKSYRIPVKVYSNIRKTSTKFTVDDNKELCINDNGIVVFFNDMYKWLSCDNFCMGVM